MESVMEHAIRVLISHRDRLFREALAHALAQQPNIMVVGSTAETGEVLDSLAILRPNVIILDLAERQGLREARLIQEAFADTKILIIGPTQREFDILACIEAGVAGCLPQETSLEDLLNHIQAIMAGKVLWSPKVARVLASGIADSERKRELRRVLGLPNLTRRELEIIALIAERLSNKDIAVRLGIEVQTVKNHIHNILDKLQVDNRMEAARYAREHGLI